MILFHGTRKEFAGFSDESVGNGAEANSALGVWLARSPHVAASYGDMRRVFVVEVEAPSLVPVSDRYVAIWGGQDLFPTDREIGWVRFDEARKDLLSRGYDGVWCEMPGEEDMEGAVCIFDPGNIRVIEVVDMPEVADLDEMEAHYCGQDDSQVDWSESLEDVLQQGVSPCPAP